MALREALLTTGLALLGSSLDTASAQEAVTASERPVESTLKHVWSEWVDSTSPEEEGHSVLRVEESVDSSKVIEGPVSTHQSVGRAAIERLTQNCPGLQVTTPQGRAIYGEYSPPKEIPAHTERGGFGAADREVGPSVREAERAKYEGMEFVLTVVKGNFEAFRCATINPHVTEGFLVQENGFGSRVYRSDSGSTCYTIGNLPIIRTEGTIAQGISGFSGDDLHVSVRVQTCR